ISFLLSSCPLLHVRRGHSPSQLEETGGGLRAPGDSVQLSCRGSGFSFGTYFIWWYRQAPGGTLQWVSFTWSSGATEYAAAVKGRASASRDNSQSKSFLFLRALQPQDSARYFCAVHTGTGNPAEL
uniref:Ig-like domain-containing protein n=1 Tax=Strigops habroptila TaxID=2489341 RepID=A0A672V2B0_STRHB